MSDSDFSFLPRPAARAMRWDELMHPQRNALRKLLCCIAGSVKRVNERHCLQHGDETGTEEIATNCFLVYGIRGTGKTTVLLSAKEAITNAADGRAAFFPGTCDRLSKNAKDSAEIIRNAKALWLDVLDLESLPLHANLLTTMLTYVRNAVQAPTAKQHRTYSILEDESDSPLEQLNSLISDATLMWEDIVESDTRNRSNRQMVAATIYTEFRGRYRKAMSELSKTVHPNHHERCEYPPFILPIDNIDRSPEHLQSIVKLANLVACPQLWIVMAGDREDFETYLERAYWKELISIGKVAAGLAKEGISGEDEALVMARRQAAASSHKLLPPNHRIEVDCVPPGEVLAFSPYPDKNTKEKEPNSLTIHELLSQIRIPTHGGEAQSLSLSQLFFVEDLFNTSTRSSGKTQSEKKAELATNHLTLVARIGLSLPARVVIDLWQLAYAALFDTADDEEQKKDCATDFRAEKIARTMLRNLLTESTISNSLGRIIQDRIVDRNPNGSTILNFRHPNPVMRIERARELTTKYVLPPRQTACGKFWLRSGMEIHGQQQAILCYLVSPKGKKKQANELCEVDADQLEPLPKNTAAWLAVLHDILAVATESWVLNPPKNRSMLVQACHEIAETSSAQEALI